MLAYYAERFPTTEVNYTFKQVPSEKALANWRDGTPEHFRFSLKAPQKITHYAKLRDCAESVQFFVERVSVLGTKLGPILFQLPPLLKADIPLLRDFLATIPKGVRAAFEFRHESWFTDKVIAALKRHGVALCIADSEDLSTPLVKTAPFAYFRLRREDYTPTDLTRWAKQVQECTADSSDMFIYFKHEDTGLGPKFAKTFQKRLPVPKVRSD